jgi:hypothetical protein
MTPDREPTTFANTDPALTVLPTEHRVGQSTRSRHGTKIAKRVRGLVPLGANRLGHSHPRAHPGECPRTMLSGFPSRPTPTFHAHLQAWHQRSRWSRIKPSQHTRREVNGLGSGRHPGLRSKLSQTKPFAAHVADMAAMPCDSAAGPVGRGRSVPARGSNSVSCQPEPAGVKIAPFRVPEGITCFPLCPLTGLTRLIRRHSSGYIVRRHRFRS